MAPQTDVHWEASIDEDRRAPNGAEPDRVGPQQMIDRNEYVRVLQQALRRLGFHAVAERLERESGVQMQPEVVNQFQQSVLSGDFEAAVALLPELTNNEPTQNQVVNFELQAYIAVARFLILQQKFVEQVNRNETSAAIHTLRHQLAPLRTNQAELKRLAGFFLCTSGDAGALPLAAWSETQVRESRQTLMVDLQQKLPPALLVPDGRLEHLLELAIQSQVEKCICHNHATAGVSLLTDYNAGPEQLPTRLHRAINLRIYGFQRFVLTSESIKAASTILAACLRRRLETSSCDPQLGLLPGPFRSLTGHKDEVWHLQFSHRGDKLASASKDHTAVIWSVNSRGDAFIVHTLSGHPRAVTHLTWSLDDSKLLTCSERQVKIWSTATGECLKSMQHHKEPASACVWHPDGSKFFSSGLDRCIFLCDLKGTILRRWEMKDRVNDLAFIPDANVLVCVTSDRFIQLMRYTDHVPVTSIGDESTVGPSAITSISLTPDGEFLLANMRSHTGHLWKVGPIARRIAKPLPDGSSSGPYGLAPAEEGDEQILEEPVMEYHAGESRVGRYVIRSCIGGLNSAFVASGSEDCRVYIWHRDTGVKLAQLDGHSGTVNGVAWNPVHHHMLASASDDKSIGIWMAPAHLAADYSLQRKAPGFSPRNSHVGGSFREPGGVSNGGGGVF